MYENYSVSYTVHDILDLKTHNFATNVSLHEALGMIDHLAVNGSTDHDPDKIQLIILEPIIP